MLDLIAVQELAQRCAPQVAAETLVAIAHTESRFNPLAIGVNRGGPPAPKARSRPQAARTARELIARGHNIDLGLAQINSANLDRLGLTIEAAFDPCRNLAAAAVVLIEGYRPAGGTAADRQAGLRTALSRYNTGSPTRGIRNGYVARVEASAAALGLMRAARATLPADDEPMPAAVPDEASDAPPASWDVFAHPRGLAALAFTRSTRNRTEWTRP